MNYNPTMFRELQKERLAKRRNRYSGALRPYDNEKGEDYLKRIIDELEINGCCYIPCNQKDKMKKVVQRTNELKWSFILDGDAYRITDKSRQAEM